MSSRKTLRKFIYIFFGSLAILNISTLIIWKILYLNPKENMLNNQRTMIHDKFYGKNFDSYEDLVVELEGIPEIIYSIESKEHNTDSIGDDTLDYANIFSELIDVNGKSYLLKIYSNNAFDVSDLAFTFLIADGVVAIAFAIISAFVIIKVVITPLRKIASDMQGYKFGKKPKKINTMDNEISVIQNEFVDLTDALDEEKKEQNRIIASISHDLKTPLTSVIGYSDLILNKKSMNKEQMRLYNEKINSKAKKMKDILNNFDDYLANNNSQLLKLRTVKVEDLLGQIREDYEFDLKANNIKLIIESDCLHDLIKIDIKKINRIISNIIDNSIRYIKTNGIIKIKVENSGDFYKFTISDNGKGVDEDIIHKIFEPLFTTDNSRKISGLGLSIAKEFVEMHGGTIKAYNNLGLTIEFTVSKNIKDN